MIKLHLLFLLCFALLAGSKTAFAQLAEIKPFDTAKNDNAATDRIFADAVKENVLGNTKEAESLFLRFIEAKPNVAAAYFELARINAKQNNAHKAFQHINKAISLDTSNKWYQELNANLFATANKFSEAAEIFAQLAKKYRPNEDYLLKSSLLYQRDNKYAKAIEQYEHLLKERGLDEEILVQINQLYLKSNDVDNAAKTIRRLIEGYPKEGRFYALLAEVYSNNKQEEKAKTILEEGERKFPDEISIQLGLAGYYQSKNNQDKYVEYVNRSIKNTSIDEQTQVALLVSYLQGLQKDTAARASALILTEKLVSRKPQSASLQALYGDLLNMNGKSADAANAYKKSLQIDSSKLNVWQQLLFSLTDKLYADSLVYYSEKALSFFPSSAMLYYLNGIGYSNKTNYPKAIKSLTTAIDYQPEDNKDLLAEMYASLADAYHSNKDFEKADKNFEEALKILPDNATVLNNYAYYLSVRKVRLNDAAQFSKKSLELRPGEATFLDTYGWIFFQQGQYEKARELIQQAIDKNGKDADATLYEHLGDVYYKLNNIEKALQNWNLSKEKNPQNESVLLKIKLKKIDE
ncbi:MAG: tetratricopeptide repeat protein [Phycisphaerales bacterium]|nr:tetratricopeptide repeat protein [Phycisphaerales bacterium]